MSDAARSASLVVRVVPDVAGIEAEFDYLIPPELESRVGIGTILRVTLNRRRVRAWVVAIGVEPPPGVRLLPINKITGVGPDAEMISMAEWAADRWLGKRSFFLQTASPQRVVPRLPTPGPLSPSATQGAEGSSVAIHQWAPANDPWPVINAALAEGPSLLITPTQRAAERLAKRLGSEGHPVALYPGDWARGAAGGCHVVGTRAAAFAPLPGLSAAVVLDAHDEALQSERSPTWNAVDVVIERGRRNGAAVSLVTPVPRSELRPLGSVHKTSRDEERQGWAALQVIDLRHTDPRTGIYSAPLVQLLRSTKRVVCVLNRKGRAQLLVCAACDEVARCERCDGAVIMGDEALVCRRCDATRPVVCVHCGGGKFKQLRLGVSRVREDLESLALRPVGEVTGEDEGLPAAEVLVGTEAVLQRVGKADAVVFLDFDQELMASRYRAAEDALVLLARASRITGGRKSGGMVLVQTRQPESEVIQAALHGDPDRLFEVERQRREEMQWPPFGALVDLSGAGAPALVEKLPSAIAVMGPQDGHYLLRADNRGTLRDVLAPLHQQAIKTRVEFDPPRA